MVTKIKRKRGGIGTQGHPINGEPTPEFRSWRAMRQRCMWPGHRFSRYSGGRGITVCERWRNSLAAFWADRGPWPSGKTLDRIDDTFRSGGAVPYWNSGSPLPPADVGDSR
jgi:hypothetical protein